MRLLASCSTAILVVLGTSACASGRAGGAPPGVIIPASSATVRAIVEMRPGPPPHQAVFVQNNSTVPIVVSGVVQRECVNLGYLCDNPGGYQQIVRVRAGQRENILVSLSATNPEGNFGYRVRWSWRPDVGDLRAATDVTTEEVTITSADGRTVARPTENGMAIDTNPYPPSVIEALRQNIGRLRVTPDSIEMRVGESRAFTTFEVALVDAAGGRLGPAPFGFRIPADLLAFRQPNFTALAPGRAVIEFTVAGPGTSGVSAPPQPAQVVVIIRP